MCVCMLEELLESANSKIQLCFYTLLYTVFRGLSHDRNKLASSTMKLFIQLNINFIGIWKLNSIQIQRSLSQKYMH